jgi:hypothetical protein
VVALVAAVVARTDMVLMVIAPTDAAPKLVVPTTNMARGGDIRRTASREQ